jgi:hypothetical protein
MSAQDMGRRLLLGSAVGALALMPSRIAQADTAFTQFGFPATGAPTARTMPDRLAEIKNVKDFGARGDGSTDDTSAIQAAINAAAAKGGSVYFPSGVYKISSTLTVSGKNPLIRLFGENSKDSLTGSSIQGAVSESGDLTTGYLFAAAQPGTSLPASNFGVAIIENLNWSNYSSSGKGLFIPAMLYGVVRNCNVVASKVGISMVGPPQSSFGPAPVSGIGCIEYCTITGNASAGSIGIYMSTGNVTASSVTGWDTGCVLIGAAPNIFGTRFEVNNTGILLGLDTMYGTGTLQVSGGQLVGLEMETNNTGIYAYQVSSMLIAGNAVTANNNTPGFSTNSPGSCRYAFRARYISHSFICGNGFNGNYAVACVSVEADAFNVLFSGNGVGSRTSGVSWSVVSPANPLAGITVFPLASANVPASVTTRTYAQLPQSSTGAVEGMEYNITDSPIPAYSGAPPSGASNCGAAITSGGGTNHVKVRWNGSNWRIMG